MRAYFSFRFYVVVAIFISLVVTSAFFAGLPDGTVAFGPYMSKEPTLVPPLSHEGGRNPDRQCPDRPWLTGDPNRIDDISEQNCYFRRNWTCRTQESNDEPVGELCMWSDCTKCDGCNHLDSDDSHYARAYHWSDCCYRTGDPPTCVSGYCIWSDHMHSPAGHGHPHDELDYCANCVNWRWRVEGRPSYSTYLDQLGRLMTFDEYIKAAAETTLMRDLPFVDAINVSLFLAGVPHYESAVRERSPYYLAPQVSAGSLPAAWNVQPGDSHLPMHTRWLADPRYPAGTHDFYALDPRDRGAYPDALLTPGPGAKPIVGTPLHLEALADPLNDFNYSHISPSVVYKFDPVCPYLDPSIGHLQPSISCQAGPDAYVLERTGAQMRGFIQQAIGSMLARNDLVTEPRLAWEVAYVMGLVTWNANLVQLRLAYDTNIRHDVSKLQHDFIGPGFQLLPDSAFATPRAHGRPAGTPAWIYSWPTATPGPTPRLSGSIDDPRDPDYNTRVHTGRSVVGLQVLTSGGELCQEHTKSLVIDWNHLDGAFFYEVEVWNVETELLVKTETSYTTRAYINYLDLSPCNLSLPRVTYELVVKAYDYTGQRSNIEGQHRSANVSRFDRPPPPGGNDGGANAIDYTMPTAPLNEPCDAHPSPCLCPAPPVLFCPPPVP